MMKAQKPCGPSLRSQWFPVWERLWHSWEQSWGCGKRAACRLSCEPFLREISCESPLEAALRRVRELGTAQGLLSKRSFRDRGSVRKSGARSFQERGKFLRREKALSSASSETAVMSQRGDMECVTRKKQRGAVPRVWEQQPAGCQRSGSAWQRTEGRDGDGPSSLPCKRTEPARPWDGAGPGGKRKASAEADASGLPLKRSHAERQRRSSECDRAPKREIGAEPNGDIYVKVVQQVHSERACQQAAAQAPLQAGGLPHRAGPSTGGRASPAACPHSVSKAQAGCKRKALEEGTPAAAQLPANKRVRAESADGVPAPAARPGPAAARSSRCRGEQGCATAALSCCPLQARGVCLGFALLFPSLKRGKGLKAAESKGSEVPEHASPSLYLHGGLLHVPLEMSFTGGLPSPISFVFFLPLVAAVLLLTKQIHLFSRLIARRQRRKERRAELKKASLRAAAARAESSAMNSLVEMMQRLQLHD
ncbi:uncharacterized protein LOC125686042 isoform X2 [Lagopus muta]|uniref:uncharacterized protein LOC125685980 isoform X2 n=1 Tax=Lagopus muta TaxID=64668 RepID=UPI0020A112D0|nr:uncharacterized protein LOC125685980 isoform X2 [Lagopus muta]XP_048785632.1 uncharacterized protein LOC125686042 isoform X2 [Lagopus muta]